MVSFAFLKSAFIWRSSGSFSSEDSHNPSTYEHTLLAAVISSVMAVKYLLFLLYSFVKSSSLLSAPTEVLALKFLGMG